MKDTITVSTEPRYDPAAQCSKCGNRYVSTKCRSHPMHMKTTMERRCSRCGYAWYEAPLDAPRAAAP